MTHKSKLLKLTVENFHDRVLENDRPALVYFKTSWSGAADILNPIIDELSQLYQGEITFGEVDAEEQAQIVRKFDIACMPTLLFFKHGRVVDRTTGVISKSELSDRLKTLLQQ